MSFASFEKEILAALKILLKNPKIKLKELLEWSTGDIGPKDESEILVTLKKPRVNVVVKKSLDLRGQ